MLFWPVRFLTVHKNNYKNSLLLKFMSILWFFAKVCLKFLMQSCIFQDRLQVIYASECFLPNVIWLRLSRLWFNWTNDLLNRGSVWLTSRMNYYCRLVPIVMNKCQIQVRRLAHTLFSGLPRFLTLAITPALIVR